VRRPHGNRSQLSSGSAAVPFASNFASTPMSGMLKSLDTSSLMLKSVDTSSLMSGADSIRSTRGFALEGESRVAPPPSDVNAAVVFLTDREAAALQAFIVVLAACGSFNFISRTMNFCSSCWRGRLMSLSLFF
jgi:hypothetical protein